METGKRRDLVDRYLARVGHDRRDRSLGALQHAHLQAIPYENLDIHLGREIRIDVDSLAAKLIDRRRGGYCFEQNTLFAAVLEGLGFTVTRCLGRVRMGDPVSPRPATHMVLLVDGQLVDVGFGAANPRGPIPIGGEATYGPYRWSMERTVSPEREDVWLVRLFDMPLYTFDEVPRHAVDYLTPNHFTATHPLSPFTRTIVVQRMDDDVQVGLVGLELTERRPDGSVEVAPIDEADLDDVLRTRFGLTLDEDELQRLRTVVTSDGAA